jgi:ATP-dependent RNA helicase RhlE
MSFDSLGLSDVILQAVKKAGYEKMTPVQAESIPHIMQGRDLLGSAQTGTGKTAAFALPILHRLQEVLAAPQNVGQRRRIRVLVLSPTRELASQIGESFATYGAGLGLKQLVIFGGVGYQPQMRDLRNGVDILIATPGRLLDLMNQGLVRLGGLTTFVLDEADRMLDMGFLPDLKRVVEVLPPERQNIMFSATFPSAIAELSATILRNPAEVRIQPSSKTAAQIDQVVCFVPRPQKLHALTSLLRTKAVTRTIVFTRTKHGADRVVDKLSRVGVRAEAIHGNKTQNARQKALLNFRNSRTTVLVATDLAARGIDVDDVSHVINYDLPMEAETYVHRIGRTGRGGASGTAITLCDQDERKYLKLIERLLGGSIPTRKVEFTPDPEGVAITVEDEPSYESRGPRPSRPSGPGGRNAGRSGRPAGRTSTVGRTTSAEAEPRPATGGFGARGATGGGTVGSAYRPNGKPRHHQRAAAGATAFHAFVEGTGGGAAKSDEGGDDAASVPTTPTYAGRRPGQGGTGGARTGGGAAGRPRTGGYRPGGQAGSSQGGRPQGGPKRRNRGRTGK